MGAVHFQPTRSKTRASGRARLPFQFHGHFFRLLASTSPTLCSPHDAASAPRSSLSSRCTRWGAMRPRLACSTSLFFGFSAPGCWPRLETLCGRLRPIRTPPVCIDLPRQPRCRLNTNTRAGLTRRTDEGCELLMNVTG
eukprot:Amastigsp_a174497_15.p2 type:complete len:139 gc:universal Amastigsp_a174497_15:456-40(-)